MDSVIPRAESWPLDDPCDDLVGQGERPRPFRHRHGGGRLVGRLHDTRQLRWDLARQMLDHALPIPD